MKRSILGTMLVIMALCTIVAGASVFDGSATATGTLSKDSQNHARVGASESRIGKVSVTRVIVTDIFGHEREVAWKYVGGKGTSRPTIKFTGKDRPKKNEHVTLELSTQVDGDHGTLDLHLY